MHYRFFAFLRQSVRGLPGPERQEKNMRHAAGRALQDCPQEVREQEPRFPIPCCIGMESGAHVLLMVIRQGESIQAGHAFLPGEPDGFRRKLRLAVGGGKDPDDLRGRIVFRTRRRSPRAPSTMRFRSCSALFFIFIPLLSLVPRRMQTKSGCQAVKSYGFMQPRASAAGPRRTPQISS